MAAPIYESMEKENNATSINLDCFWDLAEMDRDVRIKAAERLLKSLMTSRKEGAISPDLAYSIDRLIKGVGSSRKAARQGFTLVLTQILNNFAEINLADVLKQIAKLLPLTGNKNDIRNNAIGQALALSAIIRSGKLKENTDCISDTVVALLLLHGKRSYIRCLVQRLLGDIFNQLDNDGFKQHVWPHLKSNLKSGWENCTPDTLWLLIISAQSYPDILSSKFLKKHWNTLNILDKENFVHIAKIMKQSTSVHPNIHPVCMEIVKWYLKKQEFKEFWKVVIDENLFLSCQGEKIYLGFKIMKMILPLLENKKQVESVLSINFCQAFMRAALNYSHSLSSAASDMGDHLARFVSETEDPSIQLLVLEVFIKPPGTLLFDQLTKKKTVANIVFHLKDDAVKSYMKMLKTVFLGKQESGKDDTSNIDKLQSFAVHQISVLVGHQAMTSDIDWKKETVQFLLMHSFFDIIEPYEEISESLELPVEISSSLRQECRSSFIRSLEFLLKSSGTQKFYIQQKCKIMVCLLKYTDQVLKLKSNFSLLVDVNLIREHWHSVMTMVKKLQKQEKKEEGLHESCAFQIIFVYLSLQLFIEPQQALNILKELEECCMHALKHRHHDPKDVNDETSIGEKCDEPLWIEVLVDLMLSLLSQPSHLARRIVMTTFPLFCPLLTAAALDQIMDVINPKKSSEDGFPLVEQYDDDKESTKSSSDEDESNEECSVSEEFRNRVKLALGQGQDKMEDSEHYLSDSEMFQLDNALSAAFSSQKKVNNKKLTKEEVDLLHFRLRCLDLLFLLIKSGPFISQVIKLISPLVTTLEYSLQHKHQLFLAEKIKRLLEMMVKYKKWQETTGVSQKELKNLLQFLMTKAKKATDMRLQKSLNQLCSYIVVCNKKLYVNCKKNASDIEYEVSEYWFVEEYKMLLKNFLENRASNIDTDMFNSILNIYPETAWKFTDLLLDYAFSEKFRLYKRTQTLGILLAVIKTSESLSILKPDEWDKFCSRLMPPIIKALQDIITSQEVKTAYTVVILDILATIAKISIKFNMNIFQKYNDIKNLQDLSPKQRQNLQKKGRKLWRTVSKIIGTQS